METQPRPTTEPVAGAPAAEEPGNGAPKRRPHFDRRIIPVLLVLILAGYWAWSTVQARRALAAPPEGSGTVEAIEVEVAPQVAGRLTAVLVDEGDRLVPGQVIARLEDTELRAQLEQAVGQRDAARNNLLNLQEGSRTEQIAAARANLAAAEAAYAGARTNLGNAERGFSHATETQQALDAAEAQVRALTAQHQAAVRQAEALDAQAKGAQQTLATAQENLASVTDLRQQRDAAQGQLDAAHAARDRAQSALSTARADFGRVSGLFAQGAVARRDYDNAKLALDTAQAGLDTAVAQVQTAQDTLANATKALNDRLQARQGVITAETSTRATARQREAARAQVRQVTAQLAGARQQLENARLANADRLQVRIGRDTAATGVQTARAQVDAAREQLALLVAGNRPATIAAAKGQLAAAQGAVDLAKKRLSDAVVRAPREGTVSTVVARAGETVSAGLPVIKMLDLKNAYVRVYLPFRSFGKVIIGDAATITTDALPGRSFPGTVREVASEAEFTPKNVETKDQRLQQVYWVKVAIKDPNGLLKPGMPAKAVIR